MRRQRILLTSPRLTCVMSLECQNVSIATLMRGRFPVQLPEELFALTKAPTPPWPVFEDFRHYIERLALLSRPGAMLNSYRGYIGTPSDDRSSGDENAVTLANLPRVTVYGRRHLRVPTGTQKKNLRQQYLVFTIARARQMRE